MIHITIAENEIRMEGHAGKSVNGQDIVCAAVSALSCNLVNSLQSLAEVDVKTQTESGLMVIRWEEMNEKAKLLIDSWYLGIMAINQEHNCINVN